MIGLIRLLLPYLLVLFFLYKGVKQPLYFLMIPFLMFMSNSIFFESAKYFHTPYSLDYAFQIIWLISLWILSKIILAYKRNGINNTSRPFKVIDYCVIVLILITFIGLFNTVAKYPVITEIKHEFVTEISLFIGYFIVRDWFFSNNEETLVQFLFSLVVINSIASFFFVIHQGLHHQVYIIEDESIAEIINGQEITRNLWFAPAFLSFSIVFLLIFRKRWPFYSEALLVINMLAIFVTYTRSLLITALIIFLIYFILNGIKRKRLDAVVKNIFILMIIGAMGFFTVLKFLPSNTEYFKERFSELSKPSSPDDENNLSVRFNNTRSIISRMDRDNKVLGMGPVTEKELPVVADEYLATSDMVWTGVIFRWGFLGLVLFIIIYLDSGVRAFRGYWQSQGISSDLFLLILIFIITQVIESFFSWTFLSRHGFATGLWYFALLSVLYENNKRALQFEKVQN